MAFASVDVEGLALLIARLEGAASSLQGVCADLTGRANALDVPVRELRKVEHIATWVDGQLPGLRRRLDLARVADTALPIALRGGVVTIVEPVLDARQAEAVGRGLAAELVAIDSTGEQAAVRLRALLARLEGHVGDPDVMSGFYAELGTACTERLAYVVAEMAPGLEAREEWSGRGERDLQVLGRGFAAALHDTDPPAGFAATVAAFGRAPADHDVAWGRLALLQHGTIPTRHLVAFTRANALDALVEDLSTDVRGDVLDGRPAAVGLPHDRMELAFNALATDPDAARLAISAGPGTGVMVERVHAYNARFGVRVDQAFGAALAAGAGVGEDPARHAAATRFAFDAITATARLDGTMWFAREHYAAIATAWAPEMLAGATAEACRVPESTRSRPEGWEDIPGVQPRFYLSLEDTRGFLATFGHTDELSAPFDRAVGELYYGLMANAVRLDATAGNGEQMGRVASRFGSLAGAQYLAQHQVRSEMDAQAQATRDRLGTATGLVLDQVAGPGGLIGTVLWEAGQFGVNQGLDAFVEGDVDASHTGGLEAQAVRVGLLQDAVIAQILVANDSRHAETLPAALRSPTGGLIDPVEIAYSPALEAQFTMWITSTNGSSGEVDTYDVVGQTSDRFLGGFGRVKILFGEP
ncbi:hypothetical protein J1G44_06275 [Cellulomonas sp. zg-ZUI199]|uniref:Uncharacterized protein n=1 Tax=Cellulomonas wangleii TaxID=2816956 RepID=A0ABX8D5K3_9CELL|nr:hypothetical protein [Cellulomonas wangleii]MBO0923803.1 hypothetical protein [Cellulomonas wangleii]MBO0924085.1 hypothetical protein [Cellulomonas wangleii]QVI62110.1 hypothetical protein KG103_17120 [Cellulomonas wangleii]